MAGLGEPLDGYRRRAEAALAALIDADGARVAQPRLAEAMRYSLLAGGKRLRPVLLYTACEALGGSSASAADVDRAACALECIHTYSLIHDDLPAMDDDDLRRGVPTCHRAFDEATAILAGDALHTLAFELLGEMESAGVAQRLELLRTLAAASGATGMVGGQAIDLAHVGKPITLPALEDMHRLKTGALLRAALRMGGVLAAADAAALAQLDAYGRAIGLAFQVRDDILDESGDAALLGKQPGSDAAQSKPTYVTLLGMAAAERTARELVDAALAALVPLGPATEPLARLARYIVERDR